MHINAVEKFDNIVDKWKQTKDKNIVYKNVDTKVNTKKFNIYKIFGNYLNKSIDYDGIDMIENSIKNSIKIYQKRPRTNKNKSIINTSKKILSAIKIFKSMINNDELKYPGEYYAKTNNSIDLSWTNDPDGYKEIAREADSNYIKNKNDNELKLIKDSSINLDDFTYGEHYDEFDEEDREMLKNYEGKGLKILSKQKMLSLLPILLGHIQAGNNSKSLKNELRQLIYSLHRSKVLTKTVYNNLIKGIHAKH